MLSRQYCINRNHSIVSAVRLHERKLNRAQFNEMKARDYILIVTETLLLDHSLIRKMHFHYGCLFNIRIMNLNLIIDVILTS